MSITLQPAAIAPAEKERESKLEVGRVSCASTIFFAFEPAALPTLRASSQVISEPYSPRIPEVPNIKPFLAQYCLG
jgi:hypothetical protein